jgi:hypothetical protein
MGIQITVKSGVLFRLKQIFKVYEICKLHGRIDTFTRTFSRNMKVRDHIGDSTCTFRGNIK